MSKYYIKQDHLVNSVPENYPIWKWCFEPRIRKTKAVAFVEYSFYNWKHHHTRIWYNIWFFKMSKTIVSRKTSYPKWLKTKYFCGTILKQHILLSKNKVPTANPIIHFVPPPTTTKKEKNPNQMGMYFCHLNAWTN